MKTILEQFKKDCLTAASLVGDYMDYEKFPKNENLIANKYLIAFKENDEIGKNGYIAMLMLRHWKDINKLYIKCKSVGNDLTVYDFSTIIYERIIYALNYQSWNREKIDVNLLNKTCSTNTKEIPADKKLPCAQACINMSISTEIKNQFYFSNLDTNKANSLTLSLDKPLNLDADDMEMTLGSIIADSNSAKLFNPVDTVVQMYLNKNKLMEAVIIDVIANGDTTVQTSESKKEQQVIVNKDNHLEVSEVKIKNNYREFSRRTTVKLLKNLPENYDKIFAIKFKIAYEKICKILNKIRKAKRPTLYEYVDSTITDLRNQSELIYSILS